MLAVLYDSKRREPVRTDRIRKRESLVIWGRVGSGQVGSKIALVLLVHSSKYHHFLAYSLAFAIASSFAFARMHS